MASKKIFPSLFPPQSRPVMDRYHEDHKTPDERMAEHKASVAHMGADPHTTRLQIRAKLGDERALVRGMYDRTVKGKRGRRG
jgi:hypothetical protein